MIETFVLHSSLVCDLNRTPIVMANTKSLLPLFHRETSGYKEVHQ